MSVNQWKLINQLKDSLSKLTGDKNLHVTQLISKLPSSTDVKKFLEQYHPLKRNDTQNNQTSSYTLPSVLQNSKSQTLEDKKNVPQKWKKRDVSICTISSETQHVIFSLESAESEDSLLTRLEAFISHIRQFPEARNSAIKEGAIGLLRRLRLHTTTNEQIQGCIREALARLGYSNPVPNRGVRILSIDGGGIRGLLVLEMLKKLEELTGKQTYEMFDLICGVSTGAILSFSLAIHRKSIDEISEGYKAISNAVFNQSPIWGTGNLMITQSYYSTSLWEQNLKERLGSDSLISTSRDPLCPKLCAVSAVVNQSRLSAYVFRSYSLPWRVKSQYFGSGEHAIWEAARASAAAPTYFEEFKLGNFIHQDGGILVNNPTAVAIHEAKLIWPGSPIQCVVSFGTGRSVPTHADFSKDTFPENTKSTSWANKFYKILDSATDTEGVHMMLNDLLPGKVYYRFNPYLTEVISMVEINPDKLEQLQRDATMYLRRNEDKFHEAAKALTQKKSPLQKVKDFVNFKKDLYGF